MNFGVMSTKVPIQWIQLPSLSEFRFGLWSLLGFGCHFRGKQKVWTFLGQCTQEVCTCNKGRQALSSQGNGYSSAGFTTGSRISLKGDGGFHLVKNVF